MNKILVCVDFSVSSEPILEQAAKFARLEAAEIMLLHVAEPNPDFVGYEAGPEVVRLQMAEVYRNEHRQLQALAATLEEKGISASSELVQGPSADTILSHADSLDASLIIMGHPRPRKTLPPHPRQRLQQRTKTRQSPRPTRPRAGGIVLATH